MWKETFVAEVKTLHLPLSEQTAENHKKASVSNDSSHMIHFFLFLVMSNFIVSSPRFSI